MSIITLRFSLLCNLPLKKLRLVNLHSSSSQTLISSSQTLKMADAAEDFTGNVDPLAIDSAATSQINGGSSVAAAAGDSSNADELLEFGFQRPEMYENSLAGTVDAYDRHIFLCYKSVESWPARVEGPEYEPLPVLLAAALKKRKDEIRGKTRLTLCEGRDGTNGDILIFPEMIKYKGLTQSDVDSFVEDVLVQGVPWVSGSVVEALTGSHVFVCSHGSRDKRCGVCGPVLIEKFNEEIESRGLKDQVFVSPCSHVGGHKYAGNLIIFNPNSEGKVTGHWYGYVTPDDVPTLLEQHIGKGEIVQKLWRGTMDSPVEEKNVDELNLEENGNKAYSNGDVVKDGKEPQVISEEDTKGGVSCCQGPNGVSCCRDEQVEVKTRDPAKTEEAVESKRLEKLSTWIGKWDQADVLTAAAVVGAIATIAVGYSVYRRSG